MPPLKESQQFMQLSKIQVECRQKAIAQLNRPEVPTLTEPLKQTHMAVNGRQSISVGVINLYIEECEKQARISKVYFDVLKRFNRSHIGRKIPLKEWHHSPSLM